MQNFIKTIINAVQSWTKKEIKNSTADWNQNDASMVDYVKNRTHWTEGKEIILIPKITVTIPADGYEFGSLSYGKLIVGQTYLVNFNGVEYTCVARNWNDGNDISLIGNGMIYGDGNESNGEPFSCDSYDDGNIYFNAAVGTYTISISTTETVIHKLDSKYLDLPTNLATTDDVEGAKQEALDVADAKMDKTNPVGTGSFSMNRKSGTTVGTNSVAEGENTTASGTRSHAEGYYTTASGSESHAEGDHTTASGTRSHAEGYYTTASGSESHAEGSGSSYSIYITGTANSNTYQIEVSNSAYVCDGCVIKYNNKFTRIEQYNRENLTIRTWSTLSNTNLSKAKATIYTNCASSDRSHAEGSNIIAGSPYQHAQGKNNIPDTTQKYAHIVGNGTYDYARSNAHTLDWNGVGWYQGGLQIGGTSQDGEGVGYVPAVSGPVQVGQLLAVKTVDENGKPTEWEAVDVSNIEGSNGIGIKSIRIEEVM